MLDDDDDDDDSDQHKPRRDQVLLTSSATQGTRECLRVDCERDQESSAVSDDRTTPVAQPAAHHKAVQYLVMNIGSSSGVDIQGE